MKLGEWVSATKLFTPYRPVLFAEMPPMTPSERLPNRPVIFHRKCRLPLGTNNSPGARSRRNWSRLSCSSVDYRFPAFSYSAVITAHDIEDGTSEATTLYLDISKYAYAWTYLSPRVAYLVSMNSAVAPV